jgi:hypothetical protein
LGVGSMLIVEGLALPHELEHSTYQQAAGRIRDEIAALPGPEHAVMLLDRLATAKRALVPT